MIDRRYPNMIHVDSIPGIGGSAPMVRRVCNRIKSCADASAAFNVATGHLFFYLGELFRGVGTIPLRRGASFRRIEESEVDQLIAHIHRGRWSAARKDEWLKEQERVRLAERDRALQEKQAASFSERERDASRSLEHMKMGKHWRGSAVVQGTKKGALNRG